MMVCIFGSDMITKTSQKRKGIQKLPL